MIFLLFFFFARGMGFSFTSTSPFLHSFFGVIVLFLLSFIFGWGVKGSTRAIVMRFFMRKCTKASRGSRSMRIFSEVDAQYAD